MALFLKLFMFAVCWSWKQIKQWKITRLPKVDHICHPFSRIWHLIDDCQFAYKRKLSTVYALIIIYYYLKNSLSHLKKLWTILMMRKIRRLSKWWCLNSQKLEPVRLIWHRWYPEIESALWSLRTMPYCTWRHKSFHKKMHDLKTQRLYQILHIDHLKLARIIVQLFQRSVHDMIEKEKTNGSIPFEIEDMSWICAWEVWCFIKVRCRTYGLQSQCNVLYEIILFIKTFIS